MKKTTTILVIFILLLSFNSGFTKDYFVENNGEIKVNISKNGLNRIKVFDDRIKDIRTNSNELTIDIDKKDGELFVKPITNDNIEVFLKTEKDFTYKLTLVVREIGSQQIFLNRNELTLNNYADADVLRREKLKLIEENLYFDFEEKYEISAINLIRVMSSGAKIKEFSIVNRNKQQLLQYDNFDVIWLYSYIKNDKTGISGEISKIVNKSNKKINLDESMFFRNGIRAVRIEKLELEPDKSCYLYFVGGEK